MWSRVFLREDPLCVPEVPQRADHKVVDIIPGIEPSSPALQADALPSELPGKPQRKSSKYLTQVHHIYIHNSLRFFNYRPTYLPNFMPPAPKISYQYKLKENLNPLLI